MALGLLAAPGLTWRISCAPALACERPVVVADSREPIDPRRARAHPAPSRVRCDGSGDPLTGAGALLFGRRIDVNRAGLRELAALPGISRALAELIVAERDQRGPFHHAQDLTRVPGVGPRTIERLADHITLGAHR